MDSQEGIVLWENIRKLSTSYTLYIVTGSHKGLIFLYTVCIDSQEEFVLWDNIKELSTSYTLYVVTGSQ